MALFRCFLFFVFYLECGAFPPLLFLFLFFVFYLECGTFPPLLFFCQAIQNVPLLRRLAIRCRMWTKKEKQKRRKSAALQMKDKKQKEKQKRRKSAALQIKGSPQSGKNSRAWRVGLGCPSARARRVGTTLRCATNRQTMLQIVMLIGIFAIVVIILFLHFQSRWSQETWHEFRMRMRDHRRRRPSDRPLDPNFQFDKPEENPEYNNRNESS